jgi:UPF0755 protein
MKGIIVVILIIAGFLGLVAWTANRPVGGAGTVRFVVTQGDGPARLATRLEDAQLIRSAVFFEMTVWSRGHRSAFQVGSYDLSSRWTTRQIEYALATGKPAPREVTFTAIEGWKLSDIADDLASAGLASKASFAAVAGESARSTSGLPDLAADFPALTDKPQTASLEGYLFPDTYRVYADANALTIVRRMLQNFEAKLTPAMRQEIQRRNQTVFSTVTVASIVEREVRSVADQKLVADIFWRRAAAGQALQADSTVNYCTGGSQASVSAADTKVNCPWNTYKFPGLPIGPIGNPGLSALTAAVYPEPNNYWYFLTDAQGNVHYAQTYEEHLANKRKYLK